MQISNYVMVRLGFHKARGKESVCGTGGVWNFGEGGGNSNEGLKEHKDFWVPWKQQTTGGFPQ